MLLKLQLLLTEVKELAAFASPLITPPNPWLTMLPTRPRSPGSSVVVVVDSVVVVVVCVVVGGVVVVVVVVVVDSMAEYVLTSN